MGLVPADEKFLVELRELCNEHGSLLIFDEVMSGFRASLSGSQELTSVRAAYNNLRKGNWWRDACWSIWSKYRYNVSPIA